STFPRRRDPSSRRGAGRCESPSRWTSALGLNWSRRADRRSVGGRASAAAARPLPPSSRYARRARRRRSSRALQTAPQARGDAPAPSQPASRCSRLFCLVVALPALVRDRRRRWPDNVYEFVARLGVAGIAGGERLVVGLLELRRAAGFHRFLERGDLSFQHGIEHRGDFYAVLFLVEFLRRLHRFFELADLVRRQLPVRRVGGEPELTGVELDCRHVIA